MCIVGTLLHYEISLDGIGFGDGRNQTNHVHMPNVSKTNE